jgi:peptidyl-prolyl cis-trans isomerase A (cyclophilin A)
MMPLTRNPRRLIAAGLCAVALQLHAPAQQASAEQSVEPTRPAPEDFRRIEGLYALFYTSEGSFACRLFEDLAPNNVANFKDLACGYRVWTDPNTGEKRREPYYDGLLVYRVVPGAMIVGGDPLANGQGNPGYYVDDEIRDDLRFDVPGRLAMANLGGRANTNSGTWFVTLAPVPALDGKYTIIGEVVEGLGAARRISRVPSDLIPAEQAHQPREDIRVERIDIVRITPTGEILHHQRSTHRPYAELENVPQAQYAIEPPAWATSSQESPHRVLLPELPPIYGPLP